MTRVPARAAALARVFLARAGLVACLLGFSALVVPATALAATAPTVATGEHYVDANRTSTPANPQATTASQELVFGWINPRGLATQYQIDYAVSTNAWCTSAGSSGTPQTTSTASVGFTDSVPHNLSLLVSGLTSGTTYCAAISATNSAGTTVGSQVSFIAGLPTVTTTSATATGVQGGAVQGTVDPATQATTYWVVWDLATSTWCQSNGASGTPSDFTTTSTSVSQLDAVAHSVTVNISDQDASTPLQPNTTYCVAIAAGNASSFTAGLPGVYGLNNPMTTFTTEPEDVPTSIQSTSATTAQLAGAVNPDGASTTYWAAYAPVSSDWCQSEEASGSPTNTTTPQTLQTQDENPHDVTVNIPGLTTGMTYCVALESNDSTLGPYVGTQLPPDPPGGQPQPPPFTEGLPTATTTGANPDSPTTAALVGSVGPSGQATTYYAVYALATSTWCGSHGTTGTPDGSTTPVALAMSDTGTYNVSVEMTGLTPGAQYCAAVAAVNGSNGQSGSPSVTIGGEPSGGQPQDGVLYEFTAGVAPLAEDSSIDDQTATTSLVSSSANAEGQSTTYQVGYDTAGSQWCNGEVGSPAHVSNGVTPLPPDTSGHPVNVSLTGLSSGTTYCEALIATNSSGSTTGPQELFVAGLPTAAATSATSASATSETFVGAVTPTTQATSYYVAYDAASDGWCQGDGSNPSGAAFTTSPVELGAIDHATHSVSVTLSGLAPGENYCAELVAVNDSNQVGTFTSPSTQIGFTAGYPFTATTSGSEGVTDTSATIDGTVNPAGLATSYWVAYDIQGSYWCLSQGHTGLATYSTTPISLPQADRLTHNVSAGMTGLHPGTGYCAAIVAQNDEGTSTGTQITFTTVSDGAVISSPTATPPGPVPPSQVTIRTVSVASPHQVALVGSINPGGQSTTYHVLYAPASSAFCVAGGKGTGASSTATQTLSATDSSSHQVTVQITGLTAGTRYCAELVAQNASGTTASVIKVFTTTTDPLLSSLHLSAKSFVTHARPNSITRPGTQISFRDSQAGKLTLVVTTRRHGHTVVVGRLSHNTKPGLNTFTFTGEVAGKPLPRGRYQLKVTATNRWGLSSASTTIKFKVV